VKNNFHRFAVQIIFRNETANSIRPTEGTPKKKFSVLWVNETDQWYVLRGSLPLVEL